MTRVLIINAGSTSLKWAVLSDNEQVHACGNEAWGAIDRFERMAQIQAILKQAPAFDFVGHRIVHGGPHFRQPVLITQEVRAVLQQLAVLDPNHMQAALDAVDALGKAYPSMNQVAAFDTAFHATLPEAAATYPLPAAWTKRWQLRRYGFHGLSVASVVDGTAALLGTLPSRLIVCHLGGGCSVTAVESGRSVDTTMGFTPLEGLMMATRSGSIDPGLLLHLQMQCGVTPEMLHEALTHESGLWGVSQVSSALPKVLEAAQAGNQQAALAYEQLVLSVRRALGASAAVMGGVDAVVFTGGMGEHSARLRQDAAHGLAFSGLDLDRAANNSDIRKDQDVAKPLSRVRCLVIASREDLAVLKAVVEVVGRKRQL